MEPLDPEAGGGELRRDTILSASFIGTQAHHLLVLMSANPGNPGLCLSLSRPNYNALEASLRHSGKAVDFLLGYTYGKSIDQSSSLSEAQHGAAQERAPGGHLFAATPV